MLLIVAAGMLGLVAPPSSTVIVGAGPAGLATAISLARRGFENIRVVDRLPPPPALEDTEMWGDTARFYLIGIGGRGSGALRSIGAWDAVEPYTQPVVGRKDWAPGAGVDRGVQTIRSDRPPTNVIARDRLVACLLKLATEELGVQVCPSHVHLVTPHRFTVQIAPSPVSCL
jgi:2-polyprenyl-6-methoxyphenol hydroxylase-like FAD-dependent oxidoreductase